MKDIEFRVERGPVAQNEPFAIGMAKLLEREGKTVAAAELRRLSSVEAQSDALRAELKEATEAINDPAVNNLRTLPESIRVLCAQHDALLEALKEIVAATDSDEWNPVSTVKARAAIKMVEEGK